MAKEYEKRLSVAVDPDTPESDVLTDNMENVFSKAWFVTKQNVSGAASNDTAFAYKGAQSLKIVTGATTPLVGDFITIERSYPGTRERYLKMSAILMTQTRDNIDFIIRLQFTSNGFLRQAYVKFIGRLGAREVLVQTGNEVWTSVGTQLFHIDDWLFFRVELIVDRKTGKYVKFIIGGVEVDISAYTPYGTTFTVEIANQLIGFKIISVIAADNNLYIDNVSVRGIDRP